MISTKEEAASPAISNEAVFITSVIDAKEGRDVATTDVPVAYLSAEIEDKVIMVLEGRICNKINHYQHNKSIK